MADSKFPFEVPDDVDSGCSICVVCGHIDDFGTHDCDQDHEFSFGSMVYMTPALQAGIAVIKPEEPAKEEGR